MGTWDIGFFNNDMACDLENSLKENKSLTVLEEALDLVINDKEENLDIDLANKALAASEGLARLIHKDGDRNSYTKHIDRWADSFSSTIDQMLKDKAIMCIDIVSKQESELSQYWKIRPERENWLASLDKLKKRLA